MSEVEVPGAKRQKVSPIQHAAVFIEVTSALEAYFEGLHQCSVARLQDVWHPQAHLYGVSPDGKTVVDRDAPTLFAGVAARGNSEHLAKFDKIVNIDTASEKCA